MENCTPRFLREKKIRKKKTNKGSCENSLGRGGRHSPPLPHPRQGLSQQRRACRLLSPTNPAHKNISFDSFFEQCSAAIRHRGRNGGIQSASINTLCPRILAIKGLFFMAVRQWRRWARVELCFHRRGDAIRFESDAHVAEQF